MWKFIVGKIEHSPKPRSALLELPPKLQTAIISHLIPDATSSIQSVLLTCKQLYEFALPLSVHTFRYSGCPYLDDRPPTDVYRSYVQFLRYITVQKPELAQHVKVLIVGWVAKCESPLPTPPGMEELAIYKTNIDAISTEDTHENSEAWKKLWYDELASGDGADAFIAMLLVVCKRLEELCFSSYHQHGVYNKHTGRIIHMAARWPSLPPQVRRSIPFAPLACLHTVYEEAEKYTHFHERDWSKCVPPIFSLPSIRSYESVMSSLINETHETFKLLPKGSSNVQDLVFRGACFSDTAVKSVAFACKSLRSFEYIRTRVRDRSDREDEMMPRDLLEAVLPHAGTLESLYVDFEDDSFKKRWSENVDKTYMGVDLREMTALKSLVAGM
ncbi:unnamed protein product [Clonostachys rosea]|uniref:Leucine-rich repeat domain-containing protein n=1 Tax=Bionectria ochroleuca TaxID=29856 RepID=A0ABY6V0B6_BIOOC|nr:unnamed protein product [Clonostachys rosea]